MLIMFPFFLKQKTGRVQLTFYNYHESMEKEIPKRKEKKTKQENKERWQKFNWHLLVIDNLRLLYLLNSTYILSLLKIN